MDPHHENSLATQDRASGRTVSNDGEPTPMAARGDAALLLTPHLCFNAQEWYLFECTPIVMPASVTVMMDGWVCLAS